MVLPMKEYKGNGIRVKVFNIVNQSWQVTVSEWEHEQPYYTKSFNNEREALDYANDVVLESA